MDEQEGPLDFQALRAKFQDKQLMLGPPKPKPVISEKPKVVSPPLSPTQHLPPGARPSLLSSINQALDSKSINAPRVIFKDENKDNKKLPTHGNSKPKDKSDGKTKESKEKLNENSSNHKEKNGKKHLSFGTQKESTAEPVPALPPPKSKTQRKKNILGFIKSSKKDPAVTSADSILDSTNVNLPTPLIPLASDAGEEESIYSVPKQIPRKIIIPESSAAVDLTTLSPIPDPPDFSPPPAMIPAAPAFKIPPPQSETPPQIESPVLSVSDPPSQNRIAPILSTDASPRPTITAPSPPLTNAHPLSVATPSRPTVVTPSPSDAVDPSPPSTDLPSPPPRAIFSPPPSFANSDPFPEFSAPSTELPAAAGSDVEVALPAAVDAIYSTPSKPERPISALSVLERAEDMNSGRRTPPSDPRILSALEKARKKAASPTPPPEDFPYHLNPAPSDAELPPFDYEGKKLPLIKSEVDGPDHRAASPALQNLTEEGSHPPLVADAAPPPRQILPDRQTLGPAPEKPKRPQSANMSQFSPPPPIIPEEIPVPLEFVEAEAKDVPVFDDVEDAYSPELPVSGCVNEKHTGADVPDEPTQTQFYGNGITHPETEVQTKMAYGEIKLDKPLQEQSLKPIEDYSTPKQDPQALLHNSLYESNDDVYEAINVSSSKKKGKSNKKHKGAPKNPYVETGQETVQEKTKTTRFGRSEKKHTSEKPDEKELKKKEKQRLEKEKKELKEKQEREKKEQKEREKKENEMKKKFNVTGQEEAMYQAKVKVTTKGRKHDLPVKNGDVISIIRTTECPKGKWLARDSSNTYGYVSVDHMEMDFKEILELGKKTPRNSAIIETEAATDGKMLNHFSRSPGSFSDDSEEWTCDDETLSPNPEASDQLPGVHTRAFSMPEMGNQDLDINHQHSRSDMNENPQIQARQEALHKLATFFSSSKSVDPAPIDPEPERRSPTPVLEEAAIAPQESLTQETEFDPSAIILPPPDMYADSDSMLDSSLYSEPIRNLPR